MVNETYGKLPVKTTKIHPEFTDVRLTNYGGLVPFGDLLGDALGFGKILAARFDLGMGPNCSYADEQVFGLVVFGYLCGYNRLAHFEQLSRDPMVQHLLGLQGPIDENTLSRRVKKASQRHSVQLGRVTQALADRVRRADWSPRAGRQ